MAGDDSDSPSDPTGLPPKLGGKYRPIRHLASGGMGAVYEVEHEMTGERLALKVLKGASDRLDATTLERFRREARVHALLKNEHIVRVIDADVAPELGGTPFLVMDLLDGEEQLVSGQDYFCYLRSGRVYCAGHGLYIGQPTTPGASDSSGEEGDCQGGSAAPRPEPVEVRFE